MKFKHNVITNQVSCQYKGRCSDEGMCGTCANNKRSHYRPIRPCPYWTKRTPWRFDPGPTRISTLTDGYDNVYEDSDIKPDVCGTLENSTCNVTTKDVPFTLTSHYQEAS